jgi:hypothetical protein
MSDDLQQRESTFVFISSGKTLHESLSLQFSALHPVLHFWPNIH